MITDASLNPIAIGSPLSCVGAAGVNFQSAVKDILGVGVGMAPPAIIGNVTLFGEDPGIGGKHEGEHEGQEAPPTWRGVYS